jgi:hypothetical protein
MLHIVSCFRFSNFDVSKTIYNSVVRRIYCLVHMHARTRSHYIRVLGSMNSMILCPIRFGSFLIIFIWKLCKSVMSRRPLKWCVCRTWCRIFQLFPWNDFIIICYYVRTYRRFLFFWYLFLKYCLNYICNWQ